MDNDEYLKIWQAADPEGFQKEMERREKFFSQLLSVTDDPALSDKISKSLQVAAGKMRPAMMVRDSLAVLGAVLATLSLPDNQDHKISKLSDLVNTWWNRMTEIESKYAAWLAQEAGEDIANVHSD